MNKSTVSSSIISSLFGHLTKNHSPKQAAALLIEKYPEHEGYIHTLGQQQIEKLVEQYPEHETNIQEVNGMEEVVAGDFEDINTYEFDEDAILDEQDINLIKPVKAKTATVKAVKAKPVVEKVVKAKTATVKAVKAKPVVEKVVKAKTEKVTKMDQAKQLYAGAEDKSRKAMIEIFGAQLGMSKAAASTYYYIIKG